MEQTKDCYILKQAKQTNRERQQSQSKSGQTTRPTTVKGQGRHNNAKQHRQKQKLKQQATQARKARRSKERLPQETRNVFQLTTFLLIFLLTSWISCPSRPLPCPP